MHAKPDITLLFKNAAIGASLLTPPINWLNQINAQKDFTLGVDGPEDLTNWFAQTLMVMQTAHWKFGTPMPDGSMRYCNMTNGGPVFITVKDGKIVRMTPIDFDETDPQPWTINARGLNSRRRARRRWRRTGRTPSRSSIRPTACCYPMKRVDFDPKGARNPQNRGKSDYVRISLGGSARPRRQRDQALQARPRPGRDCRPRTVRITPGAISATTSALYRFANAVGMTRVHHNPDSAGKAGTGAPCTTGATRCASASRKPTARSRICLQNCEMVVFWAADPGDHVRAPMARRKAPCAGSG